MSKFCKDHSLFGSTSIGERGQVVVPKKLRDELKIKSGDNFLVMEKDGAIIFVPTAKVKKMMEQISIELKKLNI